MFHTMCNDDINFRKLRINDSVYVIDDCYLSEKIEAEIENLKINFILDELPKDSSKFPLIANKCKYIY